MEEETKMVQNEDDMELKRGPWTVEEDFKLINYISTHGEGRWNSLSLSAGLNRTGKSCRLRWLNYLRPDVRRGNITLEEQLLILELHSRFGNRWSKIAQYLPGRTDNEIKNYWRTRVQKHAKQLKCDVNSKQFKDTMRYLWMPRLVERIQAESGNSTTNLDQQLIGSIGLEQPSVNLPNYGVNLVNNQFGTTENIMNVTTPANSYNTTSSDSFAVSPVSDLTDYYYNTNNNNNSNNNNPVDTTVKLNPDMDNYFQSGIGYSDSLISPAANYFNNTGMDFQHMEQSSNPWIDGGYGTDNLWNSEDFWSLQQLINNNNNNM